MYRDESADPATLVCVVGTTTLGYQLRSIEDLHAMLKEHSDWMPLGAADEQKPAAEGTARRGADLRTTQWAAGTARRRVCGAGGMYRIASRLQPAGSG